MEPEGQSLDPTAGTDAFASLSPLDRESKRTEGEFSENMKTASTKRADHVIPFGNAAMGLPTAWAGGIRLVLSRVGEIVPNKELKKCPAMRRQGKGSSTR